MKKPIRDKRNAKAGDGSKELSLEDTIAQKMRGLAVKARTTGGYNPYDTVPLDKSADRDKKLLKKPTDLRKLSEWIQRTREIKGSKKEQS
jgi:hypothetical protein